MRVLRVLVGIATASLVAGCGSSGYGSAAGGAGAATTAASRYGGGATTPAVTPAGNDYGATATTAAAATGAAGVALADTSVGKVLVDGDGRTLYLFTNDSPGKPSVCNGGCAATWPADVATAVPVAGRGLDAAKLSLIDRADGGKQVAYGGWPLYRYTKDAKAGDVTGQKVGGVWFAVDASGNAVKG